VYVIAGLTRNPNATGSANVVPIDKASTALGTLSWNPAADIINVMMIPEIAKFRGDF